MIEQLEILNVKLNDGFSENDLTMVDKPYFLPASIFISSWSNTDYSTQSLNWIAIFYQMSSDFFVSLFSVVIVKKRQFFGSACNSKRFAECLCWFYGRNSHFY